MKFSSPPYHSNNNIQTLESFPNILFRPSEILNLHLQWILLYFFNSFFISWNPRLLFRTFHTYAYASTNSCERKFESLRSPYFCRISSAHLMGSESLEPATVH